MRGYRWTRGTAALLAVIALAACSAAGDDDPTAAPTTAAPNTAALTTAAPNTAALTTAAPTTAASNTAASNTAAPTSAAPTSAAPAPSASPTRATATPAPSWLGTRPLPVVKNGLAAARRTPPDLFPRSIITVDELPPPADGAFRATVSPVPADVLARSTWTRDCPVTAAELRYVTVTFRGFDGAAHTGELLVHRRAATAMVSVFRKLFAAGFPIERMRITTQAELDAAPTGDGNTTGAFTCRRIPGQRAWSQHAYGLAVDVNPFQNPYRKGDVVLPELATAYLDRSPRPGVVVAGGPVVAAFTAVGWKWGGNYRSLKDYMHFSLTGG